MSVVVAALDTTAAARPVLETAIGFGELVDASVEAVHISDGLIETPDALATRAGVPFRLLHGSVERGLLETIGGADVVAGVLGARSTRGGRRPVGHTAQLVLEHTNKPIVIVPPEALGCHRPFRRLLIPLEGTAATSQPIVDTLMRMIAADVEVVVLHVFTDRTLPRILDHPHRDMELLGAEFLARHYPGTAHIELRTGPTGARIGEVCGEQQPDLIVLSWSQDSSAGHATVLRDVLGHSEVPVLILPVRRPVDSDAPGEDQTIGPAR